MSKKLGILIRNELNLDFNEMFKDAVALGCEIVHRPVNHTPDWKVVAEAAKDCDYVVTGRETWSREALEACKGKLKFIARFGVGYDSLDLEAAAECGIAISNAPGKNARSVAEGDCSIDDLGVSDPAQDTLEIKRRNYSKTGKQPKCSLMNG